MEPELVCKGNNAIASPVQQDKAENLVRATNRLSDIIMQLHDLKNSIGLSVDPQCNDEKAAQPNLVFVLDGLPDVVHQKVDEISHLILEIKQTLI